MRNRFYMQYISGSLLGSASAYEWYPQSTAATGTNDDDSRYFPTDPSATINVITIPKANFGENIAKGSFKIKASSSIFSAVDDGNGNLVAESNHNIRIGNIFYPQGIAVITNPDYQAMFTPASTGGGSGIYTGPLYSGLIAAYDPALGITSGTGGVVTSWNNIAPTTIGLSNLISPSPASYNIMPPLYVGSLINGLPGVKIQDSTTQQYITGYVTQSLGFSATIPFNTYGPSYPMAITMIYVANIPTVSLPAAVSCILPSISLSGVSRPLYSLDIIQGSSGYIQTRFIDTSIPTLTQQQEFDYPTVVGAPPYGAAPFIISQTVSYGALPIMAGQINNINIPTVVNFGPNPANGFFNTLMTFALGSIGSFNTIGTNYGEILIWARQLSPSEISQVKTRLYLKYSITP